MNNALIPFLRDLNGKEKIKGQLGSFQNCRSKFYQASSIVAMRAIGRATNSPSQITRTKCNNLLHSGLWFLPIIFCSTSAQAFASDYTCKIPRIRARWVLTIVHLLGSCRDSNPRLLGEKSERNRCAMGHPLTSVCRYHTGLTSSTTASNSCVKWSAQCFLRVGFAIETSQMRHWAWAGLAAWGCGRFVAW